MSGKTNDTTRDAAEVEWTFVTSLGIRGSRMSTVNHQGPLCRVFGPY